MKNIVYKVVPSCVCWFIIPINYSYIPLINPRYWTYLHQLSLANYGAPSCRSFKKEIQSAANHLKIFENPIPIVCTSNHCIAKISCFLLQKIFTIPIKSQQRPRVFFPTTEPSTWICLSQKIKNIRYYRFPKWWMFHWKNKKSPTQQSQDKACTDTCADSINLASSTKRPLSTNLG